MRWLRLAKIGHNMARKALDKYRTPPWMTEAFKESFPAIGGGLLIDPCCGRARSQAEGAAMIMPITILEMQRLHCACKRVLGAEEWERRVEIAWESLRDLEVVTADMLESAIMDGFGRGASRE